MTSTQCCIKFTYLAASPSSQELLGDNSGDKFDGDTSPKFYKIN